MQMCPDWCARHRVYWAAIVDKWLSKEWTERHNTRRECCLQMGGTPHHQGNRSLSAYAEKWVRSIDLFIYSNAQFSLLVIIFVFSSQSQSHGGQECNEFMAYALAHKGKATALEVTYNPATGPRRIPMRASTTSSASTPRRLARAMGRTLIQPPNPWI
jgi:hypothetical protein